jgi:hypothetical protein
MEPGQFIQDIRQRCGDVAAISPAAEELIVQLIVKMAQDWSALYTAAAAVRTAQAVYFKTRTEEALVTAKTAERVLDALLAHVARRSNQQTMDLN